jgi:hypothetical protein
LTRGHGCIAAGGSNHPIKNSATYFEVIATDPLNQTDARFMWNMTATVNIEIE